MERRALLAASLRPLVMAALGDSLTDEYSFYGPQAFPGSTGSSSLFPLPAPTFTVGRSSARNWVANLAATRSSQVTFGPYSVASRNQTRNQGFAEDWAVTGATATGGNAAGTGTTFRRQLSGFPSRKLPGLLTQSVANSGYRPKDLNVVTIWVGSNDYVRALSNYASSLTQNDGFAATRGHPNRVNAGIESSIRSAVAAIHQKIPRVKIVIVTPADITTAPVVASALATGASLFPGLARTVSASVVALSADLAKFARQPGVGVVNTQALFNKFRAAPTIEGVTVNLQASGQNLTDGFIGDGFHPGTIVQGILTQAIVAQVDALYGQPVIAPLTDAEIVRYAVATQPTIAFSSTITPDPTTGQNSLRLQAVVTSGVGSTAIPTGTVSFETITPATTTSPARPGIILGTAPVDAMGRATLTASSSLLNLAPFYAVYNGDQATDARLSPASIPLVAPIA